MKLHDIWRNVAVAALTAGGAVLAACPGCTPGNTYQPPPPPEVTVSPPLQRKLTTYAEYTGTTRASEQVDLRARVKGFLKEIHFEDRKNEVKAGQLLFVIDEKPYQVRLDEAQAKLDEARATLAKAEKSKAHEVAKAQINVDDAALVLAQVEERRNRTLLARNAGSREDVDRAEAARKRAEAQVQADRASYEQAVSDFDTNREAARAAVKDAEAAVENARIDLGYCRIVAPFDGRITRRLVDVGNLVGDGASTVLATLVKDNPIFAYTNVSDADVLQFRSLRRQGQRADYREVDVPIELGMPDEKGYPHSGRIDYVDPGTDPGSGTVQARGRFDNPDHVMIPGLFVRLRVPFLTNVDALLLPESAILSDQAGRYVLVVGDDDVVKQRPVTLGGYSDDGLRIVQAGLSAGDRVVINGLQRARPDAKVKPTPGNLLDEAVPAAKGEAPAAKGEAPAAKGEAPAPKGETPAPKGEAPAPKG
ncbi:MAG: efflux RND transporter periplasmic adaptor subunit [Isosphaeraceae bacterium]